MGYGTVCSRPIHHVDMMIMAVGKWFVAGLAISMLWIPALLMAPSVSALTQVRVEVHRTDGGDVNGTVVELFGSGESLGNRTLGDNGTAYFDDLEGGNYTFNATLEGLTTCRGSRNLTLNGSEEHASLIIYMDAVIGSAPGDNDTGLSPDGTNNGTDGTNNGTDGNNTNGVGDPGQGSDATSASMGACSPILCIVFLVIVLIMALAIALIYSKVRSDRLMDNDTRKTIFQHIEKNPGTHLRAIKKELGLPMGVLTHHIGKLEQEEVVHSRQSGQYKRYWPYNIPPDGNPYLTPTHQMIVQALKAHPGSTPQELSDLTGMSRHNIYYHTGQLEGKGVLRSELSNGNRVYFVISNT